MNKESFSKKYKEIIEPVNVDLQRLDGYFEDYFSSSKTEENKNQILPIIKDFFSAKGKRIRPALIFLMTRAMNSEIEKFHYKLALAQEFIHNATLIHDDIIDCSLLRRGKKTLNFEHDSKLAVLAGDYLLSEALLILASFNNEKIRNIHSLALSQMIKGELNQYFNRFKLLSIEEYVQKSKAKTARLFEACLVSCCLHNKQNDESLEKARDFALNFGIAFQIKNDMNNLDDSEKMDEDANNGDYSAPLIYFAKEKYGEDVHSISNVRQALKQLKQTNAVKKTQELIEYYSKTAIENLSFLEDNLYKKAMIDLSNLLTD